MSYSFETFDTFWNFTTSVAGAIALVIAQLDDRERDQVRSEIESALRPFASDGGYELPGVAINGLAR